MTKFDFDYYDEEALYQSGIDLIENGFHVMPLHKFTLAGNCACTKDSCPSAGKHPKTKDWRNHTPLTNETLEFLFDNDTPHGLGIVLKPEHLIIDVDAANGKKGLESKKKLEFYLGDTLENLSSYVVISGSGSGSTHYYFKKDSAVNIRKKLTDEYPDIDFLSEGCYVVACESLHKTGNVYHLSEFVENDLSNLKEAPKKLIQLIEQKHSFVDNLDSEPLTCTTEELKEILSYIPPDIDYEDWFRVCMGVHYDTQGSQEGYEIFDQWSAEGTKYEGPQNTFDKWKEGDKPSTAKITIETVKWIAGQYGYKRLGEDVEGTLDDFFNKIDNDEIEKQVITNESGKVFESDSIPETLRNPPGILNTMVKYSMASSNMPSFLISLVASLQTIGVLAGRDFCSETDNYTNNYFLVIGDTGCGKEMLKSVPRNIIVKIAEAFGLDKELKTMASKANSPGALFTAFELQPRRLFSWDEFGHHLNATIKNSGNEAAVVAKLLELYSEGSSVYIRPEYSQQGVKKEDRDQDVPTVYNPHTCFTGITTPIQMESALNKTFMEDGTINRFMVVLPQEQYDVYEPKKPLQVPVEILSWFDKVLIALCKRNNVPSYTSLSRNDSDKNPNKLILKWDKDAYDRLMQFQYDNVPIKKMCKEKGYHKIMARTYEHALKVALTVQLGIDPNSDSICLEAAEYAVALVDFLKKQEIKYYDLYYSENQFESALKRVTKIIDDAGVEGMKEHELKGKHPLKGMRPRERNEVLTALEEDASIVKRAVKAASGKGRHSLRYFTLKNWSMLPEERKVVNE